MSLISELKSESAVRTDTPRGAVLVAAGSREMRYPDFESFSDFDELQACAPWDVLLLDCPGPQAGQFLRRLRQQEAHRFIPIYCCRDQDEWCRALGDGEPPLGTEALRAHWLKRRERFALFNRGEAPQSFESRVLAWLWLRSQGELRAVRDTRVAQHYRYPLLEALAGEDEVSDFVWLQLIAQQGWLEGGELVDRLRLCTGCGSGRLNYVDVCPECQSLDISRQPALHCFTCGNVGPQENFLKDGLLLCPNCLTRLRHIGSDYDRPLENYSCRGCQAFFIDAAVEARCLDCCQVHAPEKLRVREVRHYRLAEAGRLRCRQGLGQGSYAELAFARLNLRGGKEFAELLNWQIELVRRYGNPSFSLLGVRLLNLAQRLEALGEMRANALVDSLVERLLEMVRETDRCTRASEDLFWLLLPHTGKDGLGGLLQRLGKTNGLLAETAEHGIELRTVGFTAPQELLEQEDARLLLARLRGELG
ncbi:hypothetical protein D3C78_772560 [compost metagenome]